jgi:hypothetical protein
LTVLQFFFFGTSLTATEYFFPDIQAHTGIKYVQAHPWMLYADASTLRAISVPWLVLIVTGLPLGFFVFAWQVRHKIASPKVRAYVGSLFSRYQVKLFWWEAVNLVKKLVIALLIRGIAPSNRLQAILISLAIGFPMVVQTALRPWKRFLENAMDPAGGVLLILSLSAISGSSHAAYILVLTLDAIYVAALLILIVYYFFTEKTEYQLIWEAAYGNSESMDVGPMQDGVVSSSENDQPM